MKTKLLSRIDANTRCDALDTENTVLRCALNDCLNGNVKWFGNTRAFQIGVARADSACGGIAIVRADGTMISCDYVDRYCPQALTHISLCLTGENTEHNRDLLKRREAIESAVAFRNEALRAA